MDKKISSNNQSESGEIYWPDLDRGTLIKRYKRFLADIKLDSGKIITAHCPNSGSMTECCQAGQPVYVSYHDVPTRKYKYSWQLIQMPTSMVGVNTGVPNRLVYQSVKAGVIPELTGYHEIKAEVKVGDHSRLDLLLSNGDEDLCYVEIKNCTLVENGIASFPDAVTTRGQKHLRELQKLKKSGARCVMFYLIQRMDADYFKPADSIDPDYGIELRKAHNNGVEILVYDVAIDLEKICINSKIPFQLLKQTFWDCYTIFKLMPSSF